MEDFSSSEQSCLSMQDGAGLALPVVIGTKVATTPTHAADRVLGKETTERAFGTSAAHI